MRSRSPIAFGLILTLITAACTPAPEEATVIEVRSDRSTTSTTDSARLEYKDFPELNDAEQALCNWISRTNRTTERLDEQGRGTESNFNARLKSRTLSDPQRVLLVRDTLINLNSLQLEGYTAIAGGTEFTLDDGQARQLDSAKLIADRLASFNEDLTDLEDEAALIAVAGRQDIAIPPLVRDLELDIREFNLWAWDHCEHGGLESTWDDYIPVLEID